MYFREYGEGLDKDERWKDGKCSEGDGRRTRRKRGRRGKSNEKEGMNIARREGRMNEKRMNETCKYFESWVVLSKSAIEIKERARDEPIEIIDRGVVEET